MRADSGGLTFPPRLLRDWLLGELNYVGLPNDFAIRVHRENEGSTEPVSIEVLIQNVHRRLRLMAEFVNHLVKEIRQLIEHLRYFRVADPPEDGEPAFDGLPAQWSNDAK
jgi:hypothetical protein